VIGSVIGHLYDRWAARSGKPEFAQRMGVLTATGMIVGESLFGVLFAGIVASTGSNSPLAVVSDGFAPIALIAGPTVFFVAAWWLYRRTRQAVQQA